MTLPLADVRSLAVEQFGAGPWGTHSRSCFLHPAQYAERAGSFLERHLR